MTCASAPAQVDAVGHRQVLFAYVAAALSVRFELGRVIVASCDCSSTLCQIHEDIRHHPFPLK